MGRLVLGLAAMVCVCLVGCKAKDDSINKPPPVSSEARPDAPNMNKIQQKSTGTAGQADVMK